MEDIITAKWARKTALGVLGLKVKEQLDDCAISIKSAVGQNKMTVTVYMSPEKSTIEELKNRGFKVLKNIAIDQRDDDSITISW